MTQDERNALADKLIEEIIEEEESKLLGPACADGQHNVQQRMLLRHEHDYAEVVDALRSRTGRDVTWYRSPNNDGVVVVLDPNWGTCETCLRTLSRDLSSDWTVYHGGGCRCRECRARKPSVGQLERMVRLLGDLLISSNWNVINRQKVAAKCRVIWPLLSTKDRLAVRAYVRSINIPFEVSK